MKPTIKTTVGTTLLALGMWAAALPALAQDKPADNMQLVREKLQADKKLFISEAMKLTESEAKGFWPVYESYQKESSRVNNRSIKLIENYADNYSSMSDATAKKLVDDSLAIDSERLKLRQSYLPRFRQVLPEIKVARFYQLENKIQAVVNYDLATNIPLIE